MGYNVLPAVVVDLKHYLEYAKWVANQRHEQKKNYSSSNPMSSNYELVGILGELVYQTTIGESFDHRLLVCGDNGDDFSNGVQVKTSEEFKAKHLIEYLDKKEKLPKTYVFVKVNLEKKYGYIYSWISGDDFKEKHQVYNFGYGNGFERNESLLYI
jgi:hypothetical protein